MVLGLMVFLLKVITFMDKIKLLAYTFCRIGCETAKGVRKMPTETKPIRLRLQVSLKRDLPALIKLIEGIEFVAVIRKDAKSVMINCRREANIPTLCQTIFKAQEEGVIKGKVVVYCRLSRKKENEFTVDFGDLSKKLSDRPANSNHRDVVIRPDYNLLAKQERLSRARFA